MFLVPGKVQNVRATLVGSDWLRVAWEPLRDVILYELRHWELRDVARTYVNVTSASNVTLVGLAHDTQYSFQVYAMFFGAIWNSDCLSAEHGT